MMTWVLLIASDLRSAAKPALPLRSPIFPTRMPSCAPLVLCAWSPTDGIRERHNPVHLLGSCPGVGFEVPAGKCYCMTLAIGSFLADVRNHRVRWPLSLHPYYKDLTDVLRANLDRSAQLIASAEALDATLDASSLSNEQRFMIAHSTHSYYGSTQLLEIDKQPFWVVNEGEYCMMNTLDLAVDHVFWELDRNPWLVRNLLDNFVSNYSYTDEIKIYKSETAAAAHQTQSILRSSTPAS